MKTQLFDQLLESVRQAGQTKRGKLKAGREFKIDAIDVKTIRTRLHVSQTQFAHLIGVSVATLQNWEQGRREPEGPAKALLTVAAKNPKAVLEALHA